MRLMLMLKVALLAGLFVASGSLGEAQAGKRVALVIGNSAYKYAGEFPNHGTMPLTYPRSSRVSASRSLKA